MTKEKKILMNYLLYILFFIGICIVGVSGVFADTISDYSTKYYYYSANDNSSVDSTDYRTGNSNYVTLFAAEPPTYDNGEGFNGFYNRVNYSIVKGNVYTLSLVLSYSNLLDAEFQRNDLTNRLFTTNFVHCSSCTISSVSGTYRRYANTSGSNSNTYDFSVHMSYTFVATSTTNQFYIGSYTGDDRVLGVDNHLYTCIVSVTGLTIEENNSSTIINQNDTIINQNQQMIDQSQQNTQDIINNQDQNKQDIIDSNRVCKTIDKSNISTDGYLFGDGIIGSSSSYGVTDYIVVNDAIIKQLSVASTANNYFCFYNNSKTLISCSSSRDHGLGNIAIPSGSYYARFTILKSENKPSYSVCTNGNQVLNDTLTDDSVDTDDASSFFSNFTDNSHGLSGIISAPLNAINSMLNNQCSPLTATWKGQTISFDCGYSFWQRLTGFQTFLNVALDGLLCYRILIKLFKLIEKIKNPNDDRVEVMDL